MASDSVALKLPVSCESRSQWVRSISFHGIPGIGMIKVGSDVARILIDAVLAADLRPKEGDVVIVSQKIISKSEGRMVDLRSVRPTPRALEVASLAEKDPRLVQVILSEAHEIVRIRPGIIIVETHSGMVMANGGVDQSNVEQEGSSENVLLLPRNPDASARLLQETLSAQLAVHVGVIIADSIGRAWREGTLGTAIGLSGFAPIHDYRGKKDMVGRIMQVSRLATADALAAAANLVMGEGAEGVPAVLASGIDAAPAEGKAADLVRPRAMDLFR